MSTREDEQMPEEAAAAILSRISASTAGVFRAERATALGVGPNQLSRLTRQGVLERVLPGTYRMTAVAPSARQRLHAALMWAGDRAAGAGRSAGELYGLEGVHTEVPEIVAPHDLRARTTCVLVSHGDPKALMVRAVHGLRVTGVEATLLRLSHVLDGESFEIAFEDARRRRVTSIPALRAYLERFGCRGRPGVAATRQALDDVDPVHPARSTLKVKTRRLLAAHGIDDFEREMPLEWSGRVHRFDFGFPEQRVALETNGRRWHDDASDYEQDNEKWSVPGRLGYRIVFATWDKVVNHPTRFLDEIDAARHLTEIG